MGTREPRPDALIIGAPKAGTSALHAALARHPQIYASPVKEPKYYLCGDAPPPAYVGPGDAHSQQEWIWRRRDYQAQFAGAPEGSVRIESTPFYLYLPDARRRMAADLPDARYVVVVRDPVDRAYSNWVHLWVDGLEPERDFCAAWAQEEQRIDAGWAPFWHYRRMGRYGEQLAALLELVDRERLLVIRYRQLIEQPGETLDLVSRFLGIAEGEVGVLPPDNTRSFVMEGPRATALAYALRAGAWAGQFVPPEVWRQAARPLLAARTQGGPAHRPRLEPERRAGLVEYYRDDITLLEQVLGESFEDWLNHTGRGSYGERTRAATGPA